MNNNIDNILNSYFEGSALPEEERQLKEYFRATLFFRSMRFTSHFLQLSTGRGRLLPPSLKFRPVKRANPGYPKSYGAP